MWQNDGHRKILVILFSVNVFINVQQASAQTCEAGEELVKQGNEFYHARNLDEAKKRYEEAIRVCGETFAKAVNNLAVVYEEQEDLEKAMSLYEQALKAEPGYVDPYVGIGDVYARQKNYAKAASAYREYLKRIPDDLDVQNKLAAVENLFEPTKNKLAAVENPIEPTKLIPDKEIAEKLQKGASRPKGTKASVSETIILREDLIPFELGKADVIKSAYLQLNEIGKAMLEVVNVRVLIEGHTDKQPFRAERVVSQDGRRCSDNDCLSKARAESIKVYLVQTFKIPSTRIETQGYGDSIPADPRDSQDAYAKNRRVMLSGIPE